MTVRDSESRGSPDPLPARGEGGYRLLPAGEKLPEGG
jgi:hypothetical protein